MLVMWKSFDGLGGAGDVMSEGDSSDGDSGEDGRKIYVDVTAIAYIAHTSVDVYIRM